MKWKIKSDDTDEIDDEAAIRAASRDMVKEGLTVGREKAVMGRWVGAKIQVASVCKWITEAEDWFVRACCQYGCWRKNYHKTNNCNPSLFTNWPHCPLLHICKYQLICSCSIHKISVSLCPCNTKKLNMSTTYNPS